MFILFLLIEKKRFIYSQIRWKQLSKCAESMCKYLPTREAAMHNIGKSTKNQFKPIMRKSEREWAGETRKKHVRCLFVDNLIDMWCIAWIVQYSIGFISVNKVIDRNRLCGKHTKLWISVSGFWWWLNSAAWKKHTRTHALHRMFKRNNF